MSTKNTLERIFNRLPVAEMNNAYLLRCSVSGEVYHRLIFNGKFQDEIVLPLSNADYDDLKDCFPGANDFDKTDTVTIADLSLIYRKLALDSILAELSY